MQWHQWSLNPQPLGLNSNTLPLSHCAPTEAACHPTKCDVNNNIKLFLIVSQFFEVIQSDVTRYKTNALECVFYLMFCLSLRILRNVLPFNWVFYSMLCHSMSILLNVLTSTLKGYLLWYSQFTFGEVLSLSDILRNLTKRDIRPYIGRYTSLNGIIWNISVIFFIWARGSDVV